MALRFYLVPRIGDGVSPATAFRPKYLEFTTYLFNQEIGAEGTMLVAVDFTNAQHTTLTANSDVSGFPANLDSNVTNGQLATVKAAIDAIPLPSDGIVVGTPYRAILRRLLRITRILRRFSAGARERLFASHVMTTTLAEIPTARRDKLKAAVEAHGFSTATLVGSMTIGEALIEIAGFAGWPTITVNGESF